MQSPLLFSWLVILVCLTGSVSAQAPKADPAVQQRFEQLLTAIQAGDREKFVADATEAVQEQTTAEIVDFLRKELGARLKQGYTATYLTHLKQAGHQVYLWKLTFQDGGDDVVIRLALLQGKLAGFFLQ